MASKAGMELRMHFDVEKASGKLNSVRISPTMGAVALPAAESDSSVEVTSLGDSIEPLKTRFNDEKDKPRFVAILSPT